MRYPHLFTSWCCRLRASTCSITVVVLCTSIMFTVVCSLTGGTRSAPSLILVEFEKLNRCSFTFTFTRAPPAGIESICSGSTTRYRRPFGARQARTHIRLTPRMFACGPQTSHPFRWGSASGQVPARKPTRCALSLRARCGATGVCERRRICPCIATLHPAPISTKRCFTWLVRPREHRAPASRTRLVCRRCPAPCGGCRAAISHTQSQPIYPTLLVAPPGVGSLGWVVPDRSTAPWCPCCPCTCVS
jgi:hypothetical protein